MLENKNKKHRKAHAKRRVFSVTDIQVPVRKRIVNKVLGIKEYKSSPGKFFAFGWRFIFVFFFSLYVITGISPSDLWERGARAIKSSENIRLYPADCSGETAGVWSFADNAIGEAELPPNATIDEFNTKNSAFYAGGEGALVCGEFGGGVGEEKLIEKNNNESPYAEIPNGAPSGSEDKDDEILDIKDDSKVNIEDIIDIGGIDDDENDSLDKIENEEGDFVNNIQIDDNDSVEQEAGDDLNNETDSQNDSLGEEFNNSDNDTEVDNDENNKDLEDDTKKKIGSEVDKNEENKKEEKVENVELKESEDSDVDSGEDENDDEGLISKVGKLWIKFTDALTAKAGDFIDEHIRRVDDLGEFESAEIVVSFAGIDNKETPYTEVPKETSSASEDKDIEILDIDNNEENVGDVEDIDNNKEDEISYFSEVFRGLFFESAQAEDLMLKDARIVVWYSLPKFDFAGGEKIWKRLDVVDSKNISNYQNGGYFKYEAPFIEDWLDVSGLELKFEGVFAGESYSAYLDSVWLDVSYKTESETEKIEKRSRFEKALEYLNETNVLNIGDNGELKFKYNKNENRSYQGITELFTEKDFWSEVILSARLENAYGEAVEAPLNIIFADDGEFSLSLPVDSPEMKPGKYKLVFSIKDLSGSVEENMEIVQEFSWGVLAMNFDKSVYEPFELAHMQFAVLDDKGHSVCDADLLMEVLTPRGQVRIVSTENNRIAKNPECGPNSVIDSADYFVHYDFEGAGEYKFFLTATTGNGVKSIVETIEVRESLPFVIERKGPTRIYPKADYEMSIRISAREDFSGDIVEELPLDFIVKNEELSFYDKFSDDFIAPESESPHYFEKRKNNDRQELILRDVEMKTGEKLQITYTMDAPDISPEFYLLGPLAIYDKEAPPSKGELIFEEARQWQIASDADVFRVSEYYISAGSFSGTAYDLTLDQDLADDYFIFVRGSKEGDGGSNPDNDYARVYRVPGGKGDLADSGSSNVISLSRYVADYNWEGVVSVVECLADTDNSGFKLLDIVETSIVGTATSGSDTVSTAWSDIDRVVPFGGYRGGGAEFEAAAANTVDGDAVYTRLWPSGGDTLNWQRVDNGNGPLLSATLSTFVVEWGASWDVQHTLVSGTNAGDGADATGEYATAAINQTARDNTWLWATGVSTGDGIGEDAEGTLITLGDGVNKNANESSVAMGAEYSFQRDFDVYVMSHNDLQVDYRFKTDGDTSELDKAVAVNSAEAGQRLAFVYNGCNGSGNAHPRDRFWARYTADDVVTISRGYSGQPFPAWVQGVDFGRVTYAPPIATTIQTHFRWRDDSSALNIDAGWRAAENSNDIAQIKKNEIYRLRFAVANDGAIAEADSREYELQWGEKSSTCDNILVWRGLEDYDDAFAIADSDNIGNGEIASQLFANTEDYAFASGLAYDAADTSAAFGPLASSTYTEFEYSLAATDSAEPGVQYCFRLYDKKANSVLDQYEGYPELGIDYKNVSSVVMEWGKQDNVSDDNWTTVSFASEYLNPVFICSLQYAANIGNEVDGDADSVLCRSRNTGATSSQVMIQMAGDTSGSLTRAETVHWMVVEAGTYDNAELKLEAFSYESSITDSKSNFSGEAQSYSLAFTNPVVLGHVMSYNDPDWSVFWARGANTSAPPDATNLYTGKHVGEDPDTARNNETIGVVIIERDNGALSGTAYEAYNPSGKTIGRIDTASADTYTFNQAFAGVPQVGLVSVAGVNGADGPFAVLYSAGPFSANTINPTIMEDEVGDTEMGGVAEDVNYLVFETEGTYAARSLALDQITYRFYENTDAIQPTLALAAENTEAEGIDDGDVVRLRLAVQAGLNDLLLADLDFKLQYGSGDDCSAVSEWRNVGALGSAEAWRAYDNPTVSDGAKISASLLNDQANELQSYEEENNSAKNRSAIARGERGEWDWVIENNGAAYGTSYCFRMVLKNEKEMYYSRYPQLTTTALNIGGSVYGDEGITPLLSQPKVSLAIGGELIASTTASVADGSYSFAGIIQPAIASSVLVYLDDSPEKGASFNRYSGSGDITNLDIYQNKIILRHDDAGPITEADLAKYDKSEDADIAFEASPFAVDAGHELIVLAGSDFELSGGNISLDSLEVQGNFDARGIEKLNVAGSIDLSEGNFLAGSSTLELTSNQAGQSIISDGNIFYNLTFSGSGSWTIIDSASTTATTSIESGTLIQGADIDFETESLLIADGASFVKADGSGKLIFNGAGEGFLRDENIVKNNLGRVQIGHSPATTTLESDLHADSITVSAGDALLLNGFDIFASSSIGVYGKLDCSDLGAGSGSFIYLEGDWTVDESAIFTASDSSLVFSGSADNIINSGGTDDNHDFYHLTIAKNAATSGLDSFAIKVLGDLNIEAGAGFDVSASNYDIEARGSFINKGYFNARGGDVVFNSSVLGNVVDNQSGFYNVDFDNLGGGWTVWNDLPVFNNFNLNNADYFAASSSITIEINGIFINNVGGADTDWKESTLYLKGSGGTINSKINGADVYYNLQIASTTHIRMWNSGATNSYTIDEGGSLYSMNHAASAGELYIWGNYSKTSGDDYWSYATDFDGAILAGSERQAKVYIADEATLEYAGGGLEIIGSGTASSTIENQGSGNYSLEINSGSFAAEYFSVRDISASGLKIAGNTAVAKINNGDFFLEIEDGSMLSVASTTVDANSSKRLLNNSFSKSGSVSSGFNASLVGTSSGYWLFASSSGDFYGEDYDDDFGLLCGGLRWEDSDCSDVAQVHYRWRNDNNNEEFASWKVAEDTPVTGQKQNENLRLRFTIDNVGGGSADSLKYRLQFANRGSYGSCQDVPSINFSDVAKNSGGDDPVVMEASTYFASSTPTTNHLTPEGIFTAGYMVEEPENETWSISLPVGYFTEIEYNLEFMYDSLKNNIYCFRTQADGFDLSAYDEIAEIKLEGVQVRGVAREVSGGSAWENCSAGVNNISLVINGSHINDRPCDTNGNFLFSNIELQPDDVVSVFFNTAGANSDKAVSVAKIKSIENDIVLNLTKNSVLIKNESASDAITNGDLSLCDSDNGPLCSNVPYNADDFDIELEAGAGLFVAPGASYIPGGDIKMASGSLTSIFGGDIEIGAGAELNIENNEIFLGGSWINNGIFNYSSYSTTTLTSWQNGETIQAGGSEFHNMIFAGGGAWSIDNDLVLNGDLTIASGTIEGSSDVLVAGGDCTGDGVINMSGGVFTVDNNGNFGGESDWIFHSLEFGDGVWSRTTQKVGNNNIKINGVLTISANQALNASSSLWDLAGGGTAFVLNGVFSPDDSLFKYSSNSNTLVSACDYNDLELAPSAAGSPIYSIGAGNLTTAGYLYAGDGTNSLTLDASLNAPGINIASSVNIFANSVFEAPTGDMNIGGSFAVYGSFNHNNGKVIFDSATTGNTVRASSSAFYNLEFNNASGGWIVPESLSAVNDLNLTAGSWQVATSAPAWYDEAWSSRKKISIKHNLVQADMNDFIALISMRDEDIAAAALASGDDILFTSGDGMEIIPHELDSYDSATGDIIAWLKLPSISASVDTEIFVYYGNPASGNMEDGSEVWSDYKAVWHLGESPSGTGDEIADKSGNGHDGTTFGAMDAADSIDAVVGKGLDFDGIDDYAALDIYYDSANAISELTSCTWFNTTFSGTGFNSNWAFLDFDRSEYFDYYIGGVDGEIIFSTSGSGGIDDFYGTTPGLNDGNWHHACVVYDGTDKMIYVDGELDNTVLNPHSGSALGTGLSTYALMGDGSEARTFNGGGNNIFYEGLLDELSYSEKAFDGDWIKTAFNNQSDPLGFIGTGTEELLADSNHTIIEVGGEFSNALDPAGSDWSISTLYLNGTSNTIGDKTSAGDGYNVLRAGDNTHIKLWNSGADYFKTGASSSIYSMDHKGMDGELYIWGDYRRDGDMEHWSYESDFDGANISASPRRARIFIAKDSSVTVAGAVLRMMGELGSETVVDNQGSGEYALNIDDSFINANYYSIRNSDSRGLNIYNASDIISLDYGDFLLSSEGGSTLSIDSSTLSANPLQVVSSCIFNKDSSIASGYNINISGTPDSAWILRSHSGNYDGEDYDGDSGDPRGYLIWDDSPDYGPETQKWRWYYDIDEETPLVPVAGEEVSAIIAPNAKLKLRVSVGETEGLSGENVKMRLQFSPFADFSQDVFEVSEMGSNNAVWKYADGIDDDGDAVSTALLSDSLSGATHNESGITNSSYSHPAGDTAEWEFTLHNFDAQVGSTYYFRLYSEFYSVYDNFEKAVPKAVGAAYPSLSVSSGSLSYGVSGIAVGSTTEGVLINTESGPGAIGFGTLMPGSDKRAAHRFLVNTNAYSGYQLFVYKRQDLLSENGASIGNFPATNAFPDSWGIASNVIGYHPGDDVLSGANPSRFAANNSYAGFSGGIEEISYNPLPVENKEVDLIYRIEIDENQAAGDYETEIVYILVPTF